MTAFFISILAVLIVAEWFCDTAEEHTTKSHRTGRRRSGWIAVLSVCGLIWTCSFCVASQQTTTPKLPAKPDMTGSQDDKNQADEGVSADGVSADGVQAKVETTIEPGANGSAIQVITSSEEDSSSAAAKDQSAGTVVAEDTAVSEGTEQTDPDSDDIFFVITKEGLNKLIAASGGNIEAFDVETVRQASTLMPLSLNQSRALSPVLRTAASPIMLKGLFNPTSLKVIQRLLEGSYQPTKPKPPTIDHQAWDLFLSENSWIENPGIGQVVTMTGFIEDGRSEEIANEVQAAIKQAVAVHVQKLAKEKYGVDKLNPSTMNLSLIDASQAIAQTAQWQELVYKNGDTDNVMVRTHVLVDLPKKEIALLMANVKGELQKERLIRVAIAIGLVWLSMALSSVAFRTFHTKSRLWKLLGIPVLTLAVIPCLVGAVMVVGDMTHGNLF